MPALPPHAPPRGPRPSPSAQSNFLSVTIAITGAAGNLGSLLAQRMTGREGVLLRLMVHHKGLPAHAQDLPNATVFKADLAKPDTLVPVLQGADVVVHFAGILFKHNPEKFLPTTNTGYFRNLVDVAVEQEVKRIILISFPHVEGESTPEKPATGHLNGEPSSVHARTRLAEEKYLFEMADRHGFEGVSLRVGMVYGKGILMIEGARWFAKHRLLGVWEKPTHIHLISTIDYLEANAQAALKPNISGIYHIGDEGVQTLQEFLDICCLTWGYKKPWRMPPWLIFTAASIFEAWSWLFGTRAPLTRDFIRIGMASYYGDTSRMRKELLPELKYKIVQEGRASL